MGGIDGCILLGKELLPIFILCTIYNDSDSTLPIANYIQYSIPKRKLLGIVSK